MPIKTRTQRPRKTRIPGVTQDGPGRFIVRIQWTDPRTGKRRNTHRLAETIEEAIRLKANGPDFAASVQASVPDYAERWLRLQARRIAPSTRVTYGGALEHPVAFLAKLRVDKVRPADIREWQDAALGEGYSPTTVAGWQRVLGQMFRDAAVDYEFHDPVRPVRRPPEQDTQGRRGNALEPAHFAAFVKAVATLERGQWTDAKGTQHDTVLSADLRRMLLTAAWTGLRRGELRALRWENYDTAQQIIWVRRAAWRNHERVTKTGKARKGRERVPVPPELAQVLAQQRAWLVETQHPGLASGLVYPASPRHVRAGSARTGAKPTWLRSPEALVKPLGAVVSALQATDPTFPSISLHSLRRTWEDLTRRGGVDQMVRQSMLGWTNSGTQSRYAGVGVDELHRAAGRVVELVREAEQNESPKESPEGAETGKTQAGYGVRTRDNQLGNVTVCTGPTGKSPIL